MELIGLKERQTEKGRSSRQKKVLIRQAINTCLPGDRLNRYKVCSNLAKIMEERYKGKYLEYHSERMGMKTTSQMLNEIDLYFYIDYEENYK